MLYCIYEFFQSKNLKDYEYFTAYPVYETMARDKPNDAYYFNKVFKTQTRLDQK
jgi:7,8-dihydro-6-hydroxymethylpterin-pyrophosphokinase